MSKILLTPGPCMTSESVRMAGAMPDLNHRDPEFLELIRETKRRLLDIYPQTGDGWAPFLLGGSGTLAVEAMITSCVGRQPVLLVENGYYGARIADILRAHRIPFAVSSYGWLDPWDFGKIERSLAEGFSAVIATHNETTTGRLNDIEALGDLCARYRTPVIVDAMSSFGAELIDFRNLGAVCASANKCLHGIPGVGFVLVKQSMLERVAVNPKRSYYMDLALYGGDIPPLTPPVPALSAFRQALREFPSAGVVERNRQYVAKIDYLRCALDSRGFGMALTPDASSCTLVTACLPKGWSFDKWFEANLREGFVIYACKGELRERFFQASVMGEITMDHLRSWIEAVDRILNC